MLRENIGYKPLLGIIVILAIIIAYTGYKRKFVDRRGVVSVVKIIDYTAAKGGPWYDIYKALKSWVQKKDFKNLQFALQLHLTAQSNV